jgi:TatD DNase family protein
MPGYDVLTHLDSPKYAGSLDVICDRARAVGVRRWCIAGANPERWRHVRSTAHATQAQWAVGVHPWWSADASAQQLAEWMQTLDQLDPPAVGEIGLDHLRGPSPAQRSRQIQALRTQLAWARERDRPVILHCVRALPELLHLLQRDGLPKRGGLLHAWSGPADLVAAYLDVGLHISFGPGLLRNSAHKIRASAREVPAHRLLLETDCPDQPIRDVAITGPEHLMHVARAITSCTGATAEQVLQRADTAAQALLR